MWVLPGNSSLDHVVDAAHCDAPTLSAQLSWVDDLRNAIAEQSDSDEQHLQSKAGEGCSHMVRHIVTMPGMRQLRKPILKTF